MNVVLLEPGERGASGRTPLTGRRHEHVRDQLRARVGDTLKVGEVGGPLGDGVVLELSRHETVLEVTWRPERTLPAASEVVLAFALPRPPTLRKVLTQATALGVKRFEVFAARRVEKSYWSSHALDDAALGEVFRLGLEQSGDTLLPTLRVHRAFRPFAEDFLGVDTPAPVLVAHPGCSSPCPRAVEGPLTLVIGPEGGFVPFEITRFGEAGHTLVGLGPRIVRVETAVVAALGRLAP